MENEEKAAEEIVEVIKESVPEEKQEELAEKIEELSQPMFGSLQALKSLFENAIPNIANGTSAHNPDRKRGIGYTRKSHAKSAKARKAAKNSRRINRGK